MVALRDILWLFKPGPTHLAQTSVKTAILFERLCGQCSVRPKIRGPMRASPAPHMSKGEDWSSKPHVKWSRPHNAQDDYSEDRFNNTSLGCPHTPPYTEDRAEPHRMTLEGNCACQQSTEQGAVQQDQSSERWPMPPLPLLDYQCQKKEEHDEGLPHPP